MFDNIMNFFKKLINKEKDKKKESSNTAKERLHLVLMQDRANVSADFLELMRQEIIEVIKKYIDVDEEAIDVHLTNKANEDGTVGAPALYANIPIVTIKNDARKLNVNKKEENETMQQEQLNEEKQKEVENNEEKVDTEEKVETEDKVEAIKEDIQNIITENQEEVIENEKEGENIEATEENVTVKEN